MKTKICILFSILCLSPAFLFAQKSVFKLDIEDQEKLPPLLLEINHEGMASAYNSSLIHSSTSYYNNEFSEELVTTTRYGDRKLEDVNNLMENYYKNFLCKESDSLRGRIELNVLFYDYQYVITAGLYVNVLSFGVGYLLGIPVDKATTIVEISAAVYNIEQELIAEYTGYGKDVKRNGLYYRKKNQRFQNLDAMKKAIYEINDQILLDHPMITSQLLLSK